jgi:hypothetical protein
MKPDGSLPCSQKPYLIRVKQTTNSVALVRERNIPTYRLTEKLVSTFADIGCRVVSGMDPHGRILAFLIRVMNRIYSVHRHPPQALRPILILSFLRCQSICNALLTSGLLIKILLQLLVSPICDTCSVLFIFLHFIIKAMMSEKYQLLTFHWAVFPSHPLLCLAAHITLSSSLSLRHRVSLPHKTNMAPVVNTITTRRCAMAVRTMTCLTVITGQETGVTLLPQITESALVSGMKARRVGRQQWNQQYACL